MIGNSRTISILNNLNLRKFSYYLKSLTLFSKYRLSPSQRGFRKHSFNSSNFVSCFHTVVPSISIKRQIFCVLWCKQRFRHCSPSLTPSQVTNFGPSSDSVNFLHSTWPVDIFLAVFLFLYIHFALHWTAFMQVSCLILPSYVSHLLRNLHFFHLLTGGFEQLLNSRLTSYCSPVADLRYKHPNS